jgi:hypothetical protein
MTDTHLIDDRLRRFISARDDADWQDVLRRAEDTPGFALPRLMRRRAVLALAACIAVAVPTAAFAHQIGNLLGISNEGTPVATSSLDFGSLPTIPGQPQQLDFPATMQLLGTRDGVSFYAARNAAGQICFALASTGRGSFGCRKDSGSDFPSQQNPVIAFPPFDHAAGIAADGVATVAYLDASGNTIASTPVTDNLYASSTTLPDGPVASIEALDPQGRVISDSKLSPTTIPWMVSFQGVTRAGSRSAPAPRP